MTVKELRVLTGLTQAKFADKYHIPLQTIKQWESSKDSKSYRTPPAYVLKLLELTILREIEDNMVISLLKKKEESKKSNISDTVKAATDIWG